MHKHASRYKLLKIILAVVITVAVIVGIVIGFDYINYTNGNRSMFSARLKDISKTRRWSSASEYESW